MKKFLIFIVLLFSCNEENEPQPKNQNLMNIFSVEKKYLEEFLIGVLNSNGRTCSKISLTPITVEGYLLTDGVVQTQYFRPKRNAGLFRGFSWSQEGNAFVDRKKIYIGAFVIGNVRHSAAMESVLQAFVSDGSNNGVNSFAPKILASFNSAAAGMENIGCAAEFFVFEQLIVDATPFVAVNARYGVSFVGYEGEIQ